MKTTNSYHDEINRENIRKLREMMDALPSFCRQFFRGVDNIYGSRTKLAYAYDLGVFFDYIHQSHKLGTEMEIVDYPLEILDKISREDIELYMEYLSLYTKCTQEGSEEVSNEERGKSRKLASLRSFYNYFFRNEMIRTNPPSLVSMPKLHAKAIVRLEPHEVAILLDQVEDGSKLTKKQAEYHTKTKLRDLALLTLLLGTGIRVSECVGLDIQDIDFDNMGIKIVRKGGYEDIVYFGSEVELALLDYLEQRERIIPQSGHENAFFLSLQNRRLSVRSVEKLVKKYSSLVTGLKRITPHKLRSTYGTNLYQETGDIYLVADVLGHKDVNTTKKHYAAMKEENKRRAAGKIRLRENMIED